MSKIAVFLSFYFYFNMIVHGQSISHTLMGSNSSSFSTDNVNVNFSFGEIAIKTLINNNQITQGFLQNETNIYTILTDKDELCLGDTITLKYNKGTIFNWETDDELVNSYKNDSIYILVPQKQKTTVTLTIDSSYTKFKTITLKPVEECQLPFTIYELISPNLDLDNETFYIDNIEKNQNNEVYVFDKYGKQIFYAKNYKNDWKADNIEDGIYVTIVKNLVDGVSYTNKLLIKRK